MWDQLVGVDILSYLNPTQPNLITWDGYFASEPLTWYQPNLITLFLTQVDGANIPAEELEAEAEMTNRQCRQAELLIF